jgi:inner membrane protein
VASLGHVAIGIAAARLAAKVPGAPRLSVRSAVAWSALSLFPDLDVVAFAMKIPYEAPFGHRGASHSLFAALVLGAVAAHFSRRIGLPRLLAGALVFAVVASHGLLDAMTTGGEGVALLWPFSTSRFFFGFRPIPVAPIGPGLLSMRGLHVMVTELVYFAPLLAWSLWPRPRGGNGRGA